MGYGSGLPDFMPRLTWQCNPQIDGLVAQYSDDKIILDMGAGGRRVAKHVTTVDFADCGDTDVISNVCLSSSKARRTVACRDTVYAAIS